MTAGSKRVLTYLASPYSHASVTKRRDRFEVACLATTWLLSEGELAYSPIAQCHPLTLHGDIPTNWEFWEAYDTAILSVCNKVVILGIDGWDTSKGVAAEIALAHKTNIPIFMLHPARFTRVADLPMGIHVGRDLDKFQAYKPHK